MAKNDKKIVPFTKYVDTINASGSIEIKKTTRIILLLTGILFCVVGYGGIVGTFIKFFDNSYVIHNETGLFLNVLLYIIVAKFGTNAIKGMKRIDLSDHLCSDKTEQIVNNNLNEEDNNNCLLVDNKNDNLNSGIQLQIETQQCRICGSRYNSVDENVCKLCGETRQTSSNQAENEICAYCGEKVLPSDKFCQGCGCKVLRF